MRGVAANCKVQPLFSRALRRGAQTSCYEIFNYSTRRILLRMSSFSGKLRVVFLREATADKLSVK